MYMGREAATQEIVVVCIRRALEAIGDDRKTRKLFLSGLKAAPTPAAKFTYCRNFVLDLDQHREWAQKHLWFVK